jgi:hypothetical protein
MIFLKKETKKTHCNIREIFNYMHEVPSGHQATCKQNHGKVYGSLETRF